jgi:hypothetical protein
MGLTDEEWAVENAAAKQHSDVDAGSKAEARAQGQQDQEDSRWNDLSVGFIKTVYAARTEYSRRLLQADTARNPAQKAADKQLAVALEFSVPQGSERASAAYSASTHALSVHKLEINYSNENVAAVTQFKNDVNAAAAYLAQRAINIVSAGQ